MKKATAQERGRFAKRKGGRGERFALKKLLDGGIVADKVPRSGAEGGNYTGDLIIRVTKGIKKVVRRVSVKVRDKGFTQLYDWLEEPKIRYLMIKQTNVNKKITKKDHLIIMKLDEFTKLLNAEQELLNSKSAMKDINK